MFLIDGSKEVDEEDYRLYETVKNYEHLVIVNKQDLTQKANLTKFNNPIYISTKNQEDINKLEKAIVENQGTDFITLDEENKKKFKELNDTLCVSADKANTFANFLGPINAQLGNISYVVCAIVGGLLALGSVGGFTLGSLASFLTFNKSFSMPINQLSQ